MGETSWAFLATGFTVLLAFVGTIYATRSTSSMNETNNLDERTQKLIDNLTADNKAVRVEVAALRAEVIALRPLASRLVGVDLGLLSPMSDLHELGWNHFGNEQYANPLGIHIVPYLDDIDEHFALGWQAWPVEKVPAGKRKSAAVIAARKLRMVEYAAEVRQRHGYEPYEQPD